MPDFRALVRREWARALPSDDVVNEVAVSGANLANDRAFAQQVKSALQRLPQLRDVQFGQVLDYPTVDVNVHNNPSESTGFAGLSGTALIVLVVQLLSGRRVAL